MFIERVSVHSDIKILFILLFVFNIIFAVTKRFAKTQGRIQYECEDDDDGNTVNIRVILGRKICIMHGY